MNSFNLSPLRENDSEYRRLSRSIAERFNCAWDDDVHDSYRRYLKQVEERSVAIHKIFEDTEAIVSNTKALNVDDLIQKANRLCSEVDSI